MFTFEEHVDDLVTHIRRVQDNARNLAEKLAANGRAEFARVLLAKVAVHDASKWSGIEWEYMHQGPDVDLAMLEKAIKQHQKTNDHHPEFFGGLANMYEIACAEMVCDWLARSQEFASDLRVYVRTQAAERFNFHAAPVQKKWIEATIDLLLPAKFAVR